MSSQMILLNKLAVCVKMNWLVLIVGKAGCGKSTTIGILASLLGKELYTIHLTSESDSLELLGSFEQVAGNFNFKYSQLVFRLDQNTLFNSSLLCLFEL